MPHRSRRVSPILCASLTANTTMAIVLSAAGAKAQVATPPEAYAIGPWTFRPSLEIRMRGEYRRNPVDSGGVVYASTATLADGYALNLPDALTSTPADGHQWQLAERARIGLAVDRGAVTGALNFQDARALGGAKAPAIPPAEPTPPAVGAFEAYVDIHTTESRRASFRVGRQRVGWGSGRLLGEDDWSSTGRSLDAGRFTLRFRDIDVEALVAVLSAPSELPASVASSSGNAPGSGAQLYGVDARFYVHPLLSFETLGLARVARDPAPRWLKPSDTVVANARIFGEDRGFRYDLEGAYEMGRIQSFGVNRPLSAYAFAGQASFETRLAGHAAFGVMGAYATGDGAETDPGATQHRFDPILPDSRGTLGGMSLYAWSNIVEAGGKVSLRPADDMTLLVSYRRVALENPSGRWTTATLVPVGALRGNSDKHLGDEVDAQLGWTPSEGVQISAGYGLFRFGDGALAILRAANRFTSDFQQWTFVQATVRAP